MKKLTDKTIQILNSALTNKCFLTFGSKIVDMVQIAPEWIKFRFVTPDATGVIQRSSLKSGIPDVDVLIPSYGKNKTPVLLVSGKRVTADYMLEKWQRIQDSVENTESRLIGPFQYVNNELFLPFGSDGQPVFDYDTIVYNGKTLFVEKPDIKTSPDKLVMLEPPLASRAVLLNVGDKLQSNTFDFAYRLYDYNNKTTPLYKFAETLGLDSTELTESMLDTTERAQSMPVGHMSASVRRMKLFDAARSKGAKIHMHGNWIAAICYKYDQCHVFGRLKPKVIPGTNEIDPNCNLEDDEGITFENKAKRDDPYAEWVKDGITDGHGHCFDKLSGESGQPRVSFGCETAWCNCGVLNKDYTWEPRDKSNMYFEYYNNNGKTPYVIIMDKSRGALYQYVKIHRRSGDIVNFLNEDDKIDGGTFGNPPDADQMKFFAKFCDIYPDFRKFILKIDSKYFS